MNKTMLFAAAAAATLFAAPAFANGDDEQAQNGENDPRWFSSTGYGPNDTQADDTRQLNNEALQQARTDQASMQSSGGAEPGDDEDLQGPSADDAVNAADDADAADDMDAADDADATGDEDAD